MYVRVYEMIARLDVETHDSVVTLRRDAGVSWPKRFHSELEQITKYTHCTTLHRISESARYTTAARQTVRRNTRAVRSR